MYQKKGMSRRSFIKACTAMAAMLGIAPSMLSEVVEAAEKSITSCGYGFMVMNVQAVVKPSFVLEHQWHLT